MYTLSVTAQDVAGNVAPGAVDYRFTLDLALPLVSSVLIDGKVGTIVYVNGTAANIVATFADLGGVGVALGDGGSTIAVSSPSGIPAPGITTATGENQLTWSPIVLPTDGSADGRYTVTVTPIDSAGRQGRCRLSSVRLRYARATHYRSDLTNTECPCLLCQWWFESVYVYNRRCGSW